MTDLDQAVKNINSIRFDNLIRMMKEVFRKNRMKKETKIVFILDRSGSISSCKSDMEGGFNSFIKEQKKVEGKCRVTLVQFDDEYEVVYSEVPLKKVPALKLQPRGMTALLDAIGKTIDDLGSRLSQLPESERAEKVLIVILTDGCENSSKKYNRSQINEMITRQQTKYNWDFIFIGANQDAIKEGKSMGIYSNNSISITADGHGLENAYGSLSSNVASYRMATGASAKSALQFKDEDRKKQKV